MRDGKTVHSLQATLQGGEVRLHEPNGRDSMYRLEELNSVGDVMRTFYIHKDEIQAIVRDKAPKSKK